MNRKLFVGLLALGVAAVAVWLFAFRGPAVEKPPAEDHARSAAIKPAPAAPAKPAGPPPAAPRGMAPRWSLDADAEGPLRLEGQVVDADGHGVGGAEVQLGSVPPRTAKAEDDGAFSFDKLVGRTYNVSATKGDLIGGPVRARLTAHSDPVVIRLAEAAAVVVTVLDDAKQPIKDAEVRIDALAERTARTTDKGTARLAPIQPGLVEIEASAPGYAPNSGITTVGSSGATGQLTILLHKGYAVSGRVIDEAGKPVAKVRVSARGGVLGSARDAASANVSTTDDKGAFTIAALPSGSHRLLAVDGEHAPAQSAPITVADRPVGNVEIVMRAGGVLAGSVADDAHKPVPYATVRVTSANQMVWSTSARQATTDDKGAFELRGLPRAKLQIRADSDTAASKIVDLDLSSKPRLDNVVLVLDVAGSITGVVVDDKGAPVPEVQVNAFPDIFGGASTDSLALAGFSSTTTGGGGEFTIRGRPDGGYRIWAARRSAGFGDWGQQGTAAKTGDKDVRIILAAPGSLVGKVALTGSDAPPKLVTVAIGFQMPTPVPDGAFHINDVAPGTYDVTFRGAEFADLIQHDVKIEPGKPTDLGTVTVTRGRKLVGKVVDKAGAPVAGAKIKLGAMLFSSADATEQVEGFESMSGIRSTLSDQDGMFVVVGVPPKATSAMADHPDRGRSLAVAIPEGEADPPPVTLALRGFGSIAGKVTKKGEPVPSVAVGESSKGGGAQTQFTQTGADGTFSLARVPEGPHVLNVVQPALMSMKSTSVPVQVTAGKQTTANIEIPVGDVTATVQVKALPGNKVDAAQVFLFAGSVNITTGKQLVDGMFQSTLQGMKFWLGAGKPPPEFSELVAGAYSICAIPITGDMNDRQFIQRVQENTQVLKVICKPARVAASPAAQTLEIELPAMTALPAPTK
jgi:protocatechuate 3,4-dioxygenase beta subunit